MQKLLDLLYLIRKLLEWIRKYKYTRKEYTREEFINSVKELSKDPKWRAKMLLDSLNWIKNQKSFSTIWVNKDDLVQQTFDRNMSCGTILSFGNGIYALKKEDWIWLIDVLQQNQIKYVSELTDCDNFTTFFKGFSDYIVGKEVVIYTTGAVLYPQKYSFSTGQQYEACICLNNAIIGGHAWCRIVTDEKTECEKTGTTEKVTYNFRIYNYEPQSDEIGDNRIGNWCYASGFGLPTIYGES